jgi:hypothetical protein
MHEMAIFGPNFDANEHLRVFRQSPEPGGIHARSSLQVYRESRSYIGIAGYLTTPSVSSCEYGRLSCIVAVRPRTLNLC